MTDVAREDSKLIHVDTYLHIKTTKGRKWIHSHLLKVAIVTSVIIYMLYAAVGLGAPSSDGKPFPPPHLELNPEIGLYGNISIDASKSSNPNGGRVHIQVGFVLPLWFRKNEVPLLRDLTFGKICLPLIINKRTSRLIVTVYFGTESSGKNKHLSKTMKAVVTANGTLIDMMNTLARKAYIDGMDYIVRVTDTENGWDGCDVWLNSAVRALRTLTPANVGVAMPVFRGGPLQSTASPEMVHRTHMDIFYNYYPPELDERNAHLWMTSVYTHAQLVQVKIKEVPKVYSKSMGNEKNNATVKKDLQQLAIACRSRLQSYLVQHELVSPSSLHTPTTAVITDYFLGVVVVMAPQRNKGLPGYILGSFGPRLCLFFHMLQTVDKFLNAAHGTHYPIVVIISADPYEDPENNDAEYTQADRERIRSWAPNSEVRVIEINMYTEDALTAGTDREQILRWGEGKDGGTRGRALGYRSMCRLWSGRLQRMAFLQQYKYYMRLDDDSYFKKALPKDPFKEMERLSLLYAYIERSDDPWGYQHLKTMSKSYGKLSGTMVPYTNFHMARVDFFQRENVTRYLTDLERTFTYYKYRLGDATLHGALLDLFMKKKEYTEFRWISYGHNRNGNPGYPPKQWAQQCGHIEARTKNVNVTFSLLLD